MTTILSPRFVEAVGYAVELHRHQCRKGTAIPYASHLLAVAGLVLEDGATEDEAIGAALHDAVEDQGGAPVLEAIRRRFGEAVAGIVAGCSDTDRQPKPPWRERKETFLEHLRQAPRSVLLVKAADALHNARSLLSDYLAVGEELWRRFPEAGSAGTRWYMAEVAARLKARLPESRNVQELERVVEALNRAVAQAARR